MKADSRLTTEDLSGAHKRYLKGLAHKLKPVVRVGQYGVSDAILEAIDVALDTHELIKVKFIDFKEKRQKQRFCLEIVRTTGAQQVGMIGHTLILFRPHKDPGKRRIRLPDQRAS